MCLFLDGHFLRVNLLKENKTVSLFGLVSYDSCWSFGISAEAMGWFWGDNEMGVNHGEPINMHISIS